MSTESLTISLSESLCDYLPTRLTESAGTLARGARIVAVEAFATFRHIIPAAISSYAKLYITHDLTMHPLQVQVDKVQTTAYLYLHGPLRVNQDQE